MSVSSYGSETVSSGDVKILKDTDLDLRGKHVLIVEEYNRYRTNFRICNKIF